METTWKNHSLCFTLNYFHASNSTAQLRFPFFPFKESQTLGWNVSFSFFISFPRSCSPTLSSPSTPVAIELQRKSISVRHLCPRNPGDAPLLSAEPHHRHGFDGRAERRLRREKLQPDAGPPHKLLPPRLPLGGTRVRMGRVRWVTQPGTQKHETSHPVHRLEDFYLTFVNSSALLPRSIRTKNKRESWKRPLRSVV